MNTCSLWKLRHKWQDVDAGVREGGAASDSVLISLLESDPSPRLDRSGCGKSSGLPFCGPKPGDAWGAWEEADRFWFTGYWHNTAKFELGTCFSHPFDFVGNPHL